MLRKVLFLKGTLAKATRVISAEKIRRWRVTMIVNFKYLMGHPKLKDAWMILQVSLEDSGRTLGNVRRMKHPNLHGEKLAGTQRR